VADARLAALRIVLGERNLDGVLLSRTSNKRYYSGFRLGDAEGPTSGYAGTLLVTRDATLILADPRYTEQAEWTGGVRDKAASPRSGERQMRARFCRVSSKAKPWAPPS
jgi:Xaa-Pro aminopeptidase